MLGMNVEVGGGGKESEFHSGACIGGMGVDTMEDGKSS